MLIDLEEYRNRRRQRAARVQPLRVVAGGALATLPAIPLPVCATAVVTAIATAAFADIAMPDALELADLLAEASLI